MKIQNYVPLLALFFLCSCTKERNQPLVGAKIYESTGDYTALFKQWKKLGIQAAFASQELISEPAFREAAKAQQISTFVIFPVFFNPGALAADPKLYALTAEGRQARDAWVEFVCPSRTAYRKEMIAKVRQLIRQVDPDGISVDFIRFFVFWEKVYPGRDPASLPRTCFDSVCLENFQAATNIVLPDALADIPQKAAWIRESCPQEWTRWRCELISSMLEEIAEAAREIKPEIKINVHLVPWAEGDFHGAITEVAGQDVPTLSAHCDYLSPMTYAHMVKQDPLWIHRVVKDLYRQTGGYLLPSIQVDKAYLDTDLDVKEFEQSLEEALKPPSKGVIFWSWESLNTDPAKKQVVQKHCAPSP